MTVEIEQIVDPRVGEHGLRYSLNSYPDPVSINKQVIPGTLGDAYAYLKAKSNNEDIALREFNKAHAAIVKIWDDNSDPVYYTLVYRHDPPPALLNPKRIVSRRAVAMTRAEFAALVGFFAALRPPKKIGNDSLAYSVDGATLVTWGQHDRGLERGHGALEFEVGGGFNFVTNFVISEEG